MPPSRSNSEESSGSHSREQIPSGKNEIRDVQKVDAENADGRKGSRNTDRQNSDAHGRNNNTRDRNISNADVEEMASRSGNLGIRSENLGSSSNMVKNTTSLRGRIGEMIGNSGGLKSGGLAAVNRLASTISEKAFDGVEENVEDVRFVRSLHGGIASASTSSGKRGGTSPVASHGMVSSHDRSHQLGNNRMNKNQLAESRGISNKISIDDATMCTPFSKVRNRWHQQELDGEFASPFCDENSINANIDNFLPPTTIRDFVEHVGNLILSESRSFDRMREQGFKGLWVRKVPNEAHGESRSDSEGCVERKFIGIFVEQTDNSGFLDDSKRGKRGDGSLSHSRESGRSATESTNSPLVAANYAFIIRARPNLKVNFSRDTDAASHRVTGDRSTGELPEGVEELLTLPATLITNMGGSSTTKSWNYQWSEAQIRYSGAQAYMKWNDSLSHTASVLIVNGKTNPSSSLFIPKSNEALWTRQVLGAIDIKRVNNAENNADDAVNGASQNPICLYPDISELRPARQNLIYFINNIMMSCAAVVNIPSRVHLVGLREPGMATQSEVRGIRLLEVNAVAAMRAAPTQKGKRRYVFH